MRSLKYVLPVLLFLIVAGALLLGLDRNPAEIPSPLIGKPAPQWSLPRLAAASAPAAATGSGPNTNGTHDATTGALGEQALRGSPYLVNVWASWCAPCLQEHPQMIDLARRKVIRIVGINYKDRPEDALAWLARHGNPFSDTVADRDGRTAIDFGVYGVPETFLIDAKGVIRFKQIGALTATALQEKLLPAIKELAAAPLGASGENR